MGLGSFKDDDDSTNENEFSDESGSRRYTKFDQVTFEEFLESLPADFHIVGTDEDSNLKFTREVVYGSDELGNDDLQLRIYSTISERTGEVRDKGEDAIRTVIWSKKMSMPVGGRTKTLRIETWRKNLGNKVVELLNQWQDKVVECDECGSWMVKRDGKNGEFFGCSKYPVCKNTENITKLREAEGKDV